MHIRVEEFISAPVGRVFEVFSDIEHAAERIEGIAKLEILSETRSGKGLRWRETRVMMGREATEEMEITAWDSPNGYRVEARSNGTRYLSDIRFRAEGDATRVVWHFEGFPETLTARAFGLLTFLFAGATRKALRQDVQDLKRHIEAAS